MPDFSNRWKRLKQGRGGGVLERGTGTCTGEADMLMIAVDKRGKGGHPAARELGSAGPRLEVRADSAR